MVLNKPTRALLGSLIVTICTCPLLVNSGVELNYLIVGSVFLGSATVHMATAYFDLD